MKIKTAQLMIFLIEREELKLKKAQLVPSPSDEGTFLGGDYENYYVIRGIL